MLQVKSALKTNIAYDGGAEAKATSKRISKKVTSVEIKPGINNLTDDQMSILNTDPFFKKHVGKGFMSVVQPPKPVADPPKPKGKLVKDEMATFVSSFLALDAAGQAAMLPTLTPEQVAAVEKAKANV